MWESAPPNIRTTLKHRPPRIARSSCDRLTDHFHCVLSSSLTARNISWNRLTVPKISSYSKKTTQWKITNWLRTIKPSTAEKHYLWLPPATPQKAPTDQAQLPLFFFFFKVETKWPSYQTNPTMWARHTLGH